MKTLIALVVLAAAQSAGAEDELLLAEQILDYGPIHEAICEPTQNFRLIGNEAESYFAHIVQERYKYQSRCLATQGFASLYKQEGEKFRKLWSQHAGDPSVGLRLSMEQHGDFLLLIFDYSRGGNGNFSNQTAYVVDEIDNIVPLDESAVYEWAEKQLLPEQQLHTSSRINYSSKPISYHVPVIRTRDHRHAAPQTRLLVEAKINSNGSSYALDVTNAFDIGKSNYHNDQGLVAYRAEDFDAAISGFQHSIDTYPRNWQAYTNLGLAYFKVSDYDSSIEASTIVLDSEGAGDEYKANASFNIGLAYQSKGALDDALRYYVQANQLSPSQMRKDAIARLEDPSTDIDLPSSK